MKPRILNTARLSFPLAAALAAMLVSQSTKAGQIWDGGGATNNWNLAGNWDGNSGGVLPNFANAITFTGNTRNAPTNDLLADTTIGGINFTNDGSTGKTSAFTLSANRITLGGNIATTANTAGSTITDTISLAMILNGDRIVTTNQQSATVRHNLTISSIISESGSRSLTKAGGSVLTLTGANSYSGATIINAGTLDLGGGAGTGEIASTVLTLGGGALSYTRNDSQTETFTTTNINAGGAAQLAVSTGNILNLGTVTRGAGGALNFANVGAGTVAALLASNDATGIMSGFTFGDTWAVANDPAVAINGLANASYTLSSVILDAALSYNALNIDVDSSQTPDADITPNSLRFSEAAANTLTLTGAANVITSGGILVGSAVGSNLSTITGGTLAGANTKDLGITQNNTSGGLTISSIIGNNTGATALIKSGAGLLTLSGSNTFTGGLTINAGTVTLNNPGALFSTAGSENAVTFGSGSTGTLTLNANSVVVRSLNTNTNAGSAIVENANVLPATLTIGNSGNANSTFAGIIQDGTGGGTFALSKAGTGTLTLSGANTYSGGTALTAGTVVINNATSFGASTGAVTVTGTSRINASGGITYANAINVGAALTLQIPAATPGTATFNGQLTGSSPITVVATGVNAVVGTYAFTNANNTFSGNILMPTGTSNSSPSTSGNDTFSFSSLGDAGNVTFQKYGNSNAVAYAGASAITFNTRQIVLGTVFGGLFDGGGVNPVNSFQNNATNAAHTVTFNTNITPTTVFQAVSNFFFGGSNTGDNTFAGTISNPTNFNLGIGKADAGRWILTGANSSYLGNVTIANGTLAVNAIDVFANNQPLGKSSLIQLGNSSTSGTLEFIGSANSSTDKQVVLGLLTNNNQVGAGGIANNSTTGTLTFSNPTFNSINGATVTTVTRTLTLGGSNTGANTISGTIQNNAAAAAVVLTKTGTGTWVLPGANSYSGATTIQAGSLVAGTNSAVSTTGAFGNTNSAIVLGNASTLAGSAPSLLINGAFTVGRAITVGSVAAAGVAYNATIGGSNTTATSTYTGNITLNTTADSYTATLQAATGGAVEFSTGTWTTNNKNIRIGSTGNTGTVRLSNNIATSGGINLNFGTLALNSALTGNMTVSNGNLGGIGSISGTVIMGDSVGSSDSILAPGNGIGAIATGDLTFNSDSTYACELNATAVTSDVANVTGTIAINATATLTVSLTGSLASSQKYFIVANDGGDLITTTFSGLAQGAVVGNFGGTDLKISYTGDSGTSAITGGNDIVLYTDASGSTPYDNWTTTGPFANPPFSNTLPGVDFDNDGIDNLLEFVLGGDPTISQAGIAPTVSTSGSNLVMSFKRSDAAELAPAVTVKVELSTDLSFSTPSDDITIGPATDAGPILPSGASYTVTNSGGFDTITLTIPQGAAPKKFARIKAVKP